LNTNLYYCVLKNYKGLFKKKHVGNTHLLFIPVTEKVSCYVVLIGKLKSEENTFASQLITKLPNVLVQRVVDGEVEYFKDRFIIVEKLKCKPEKIEDGNYKISLLKKSKYILSDLEFKFSNEYSSDKQKIFLLKGNLNLEIEDVNNISMKVSGVKKMSFIGKNRFLNFLKSIWR